MNPTPHPITTCKDRKLYSHELLNVNGIETQFKNLSHNEVFSNCGIFQHVP